MVKKLKHLLTKKDQWSLLFKALIFTALLSAFTFTNSLIWAVFFVLVGFIFYFLEPREIKELKTSYFFTLLLPVVLVNLISYTPLSVNLLVFIKISLIVVAITLIYLILSLINYKLKNRDFFYSLINTVLFILLYIAIFSYITPFALGWSSLFLILGVFLLFNETLHYHNLRKPGFSLIKNKRSFLTGLTIALVSLELSWVSLVLPLGIINSAVFLTLITVVCRDIVLAHFKGKLQLSFLLQQFTFLVLLIVILFAATNWSI